MDHLRAVLPDGLPEPYEQAGVPPDAPRDELNGNRDRGKLFQIEILRLEANDATADLRSSSESLDELDGLPFLPTHTEGVEAQQDTQRAFVEGAGACSRAMALDWNER